MAGSERAPFPRSRRRAGREAGVEAAVEPCWYISGVKSGPREKGTGRSVRRVPGVTAGRGGRLLSLFLSTPQQLREKRSTPAQTLFAERARRGLGCEPQDSSHF